MRACLQASGVSDSDAISTSDVSLQPSNQATVPTHLQPPVPGQQPDAIAPLPDAETYQGEGGTFMQNPVYR